MQRINCCTAFWSSSQSGGVWLQRTTSTLLPAIICQKSSRSGGQVVRQTDTTYLLERISTLVVDRPGVARAVLQTAS